MDEYYIARERSLTVADMPQGTMNIVVYVSLCSVMYHHRLVICDAHLYLLHFLHQGNSI